MADQEEEKRQLTRRPRDVLATSVRHRLHVVPRFHHQGRARAHVRLLSSMTAER